MAPALTLTLRQARLAVAARQGLLDAHRSPPPLSWTPATSAATLYLAAFARRTIVRRAELDDAVFARDALTLTPGPRGLTWLVPVGDAPLARAFAVADHTSREARVASACLLTSRDLQSTRDALRNALATPRTPAELLATLPAAALKPLSTPGRRAGVSTLAGLVMRGLWAQGEVTRVPAEPRLDHDGVRYAIEPHPRVIPTAAEAVDLVAARWLASHAPVRARDFALAFGIAAGRASSALSPLKPLHITVDGTSDAYLAPPDFVAPDDTSSGAALLPLHDPCVDAREQLALVGSPAMAQSATLRHLGIGPVVLIDGEAVGAWSWDDGRLAMRLAAGIPDAYAKRASDEAARVAEFIVRELRGAVALHGARAPRVAPLDHGDVTSER